MRELGELQRTDRGFEFIEFKDRYGVDCSLQQSSLAEYTQPGASAVWLGTKDRMHLDRMQVGMLIQHLQCWLKTGSFQKEAAR